MCFFLLLLFLFVFFNLSVLCVQGTWRVTTIDEEMEGQRRKEFTDQVCSFNTDITVLQDTFKVGVGVVWSS